MGDRRNVEIRVRGNPPLFLYTHWDGTDLPDTVAKSLARSTERWDDAPYLARIIFRDMIRGDEDGLSGYGIATVQQDDNHPNIVINVDQQTVSIGNDVQSFSRFASSRHKGA